MSFNSEEETALRALLAVTNKTISDLESAPTLVDDMLLPVEDGSGTFGASVKDVKNYTEKKINELNSIATAAGTTTLTASSAPTTLFTGSTAQNCDAPVVSTLYLGKRIEIVNKSSGVVTARSSGGDPIQAMASNTRLILICISLSGTGTASWIWVYLPLENSLQPTLATQSDQETATSTTTFVSPGRQQYHPSSSKAWVNFNGNGTVAIRIGYNVSSVTDQATGRYTVNFTTSFSSANYAFAGMTKALSAQSSEGQSKTIQPTYNVNPTASALDVTTTASSIGREDYDIVSVVCFGDQ